jgi:hypothetical protein
MGDILLAMVGIACVWMLTGVLLLCFTPVFIQRGAPLLTRAAMVADAALRFPAHYIVHGSAPAVSVKQGIMPPEEEERFKDWMTQFCQCDACRRERGE